MKTITFEAKPIETAPKDRYIYLYARGYWRIGKWNSQKKPNGRVPSAGTY